MAETVRQRRGFAAPHANCRRREQPTADNTCERRRREPRARANAKRGISGAQKAAGRAAARDPGALLRPVASAALLGSSLGLPPARRLLPHGGLAHDSRRAARHRSRRSRHRRGGRRPLPRRQARPPPRRGAGLPADGDRLRHVPAADRAELGRRRREGARVVRPRHADDRPTARAAPAGAREGHDCGDALVSDELVEPVTETPDLPPVMPVLPLKETVVFPESMTPLAIGQERSIKLIDDVAAGERLLALVTVKNEDADPPAFEDLYDVGTAAIVHKLIRVPDGSLRILVQGIQRIHLDVPAGHDPYLMAEFSPLGDVLEETPEVEALTRNVQSLFARIIALVPYLPEELELAAANVDDPSALCHLVASTLRLKTEEKQELLEDVSVEQRLRHVSRILNRELEVFELGTRIQSQVQSEMEKGQREFFLRQQLKAIQDELGEGDPEQAEVNDLRERIAELGELPEDVRKAVDRELARLEKLPPAAAEYGVIRTYLEWILTLPWNSLTDDNLDLDHARGVLDEDHFDLDKVKDRIIEYLAVAKLRNEISGQILCFVGPPGVGKTSLGHSIARALGRKFLRISVGGVRDEAEIRGHRRTYIGAMPGTILRSLRDAESSNPLMLVDEIDKMGADFRGDPSSAMLEVLDPEQNRSFRDHYLDLPFDLSKVLFICTANTTDTIPGPLLDRMDIIQLSGYTEA